MKQKSEVVNITISLHKDIVAEIDKDIAENPHIFNKRPKIIRNILYNHYAERLKRSKDNEIKN